jgi:hypothetical protein
MASGSGLPTPERENNRYAHPLPDITEILDPLGQAKYFTCLYVVMGYHQIKLEEEEGPKTAFSTKQGHWEYRRLPFGLKTAPATFQKLMKSVFSGLTRTRCCRYCDICKIPGRPQY